MVRFLGFFAFALAALAFAGASAPVKSGSAQEPVVACGAELAAVEAAVLAAGSLSAKDEAGLLGKVASAEGKVAEGKPADAVRALEGIVVKVAALIADGKVDAAEGQAILDATAAAANCVQPPAATA